MFTIIYEWQKDPNEDDGILQRYNLMTESVKKGQEWPFATITEFSDELGKFYTRVLVRTDPDDGYGQTFTSLDEAKTWIEEFLFLLLFLSQRADARRFANDCFTAGVV